MRPAGVQFSNLCGTVYRRGDLLFTPDGNTIVSPVGNRVSLFDLVRNCSSTLPFECRTDIRCMALAPNGTLLLTVDRNGHAMLANIARRVVLHQINFKQPVRCVRFSPDGRFLAVALGRLLQVWRVPGLRREFAPFVLHRTYAGFFDTITCVDWSPDARLLLVGSRDLTTRVFTLDPLPGYRPVVLSGHRDTIVACFFAHPPEQSGDGAAVASIYTVSRDGALFVWRGALADVPSTRAPSEAPASGRRPRWWLYAKHFFMQTPARTTSAALHAASGLLAVGFSTGVFGLYNVPDFANIHMMSISQKHVSSVAINSSGEWLAFGCSRLGQLLVWEWQSETYVLKQQGHFYGMNVLAYSRDGQQIVTGGEDGKVKVWNTSTGFCFVTFREHTAAITGVAFSAQGHSVFSASLDGTVRAFDLTRYRNFRTFTSPEPAQFASLALDPDGEIVCAGARDSFEIFVWSVKTGRLLDVFSGHTAPVASLAFSPVAGMLVSGSWDRTVRVWDVFEHKAAVETLVHDSDVLAVAFRPDGREVCAATLDGQLCFWDIANAVQMRSVEGRRDVASGRRVGERRAAVNSTVGKCFTSIAYTADGECVLAGGRSKYMCLYDASQTTLLRRYQISANRSLDGVLDMLSSRRMTDAGPVEQLDVSDTDDDDGEGRDDPMDEDPAVELARLPGVYRGSMSSRRVRPEVRAYCVRFSPTGRAWAAATTEGLLIYSLDESVLFDPFELDMSVTPDAVAAALRAGEYARALAIAVRLGEAGWIRAALESVPQRDVRAVATALHGVYVTRLLAHLAERLGTSARLEYYLNWTHCLLSAHGPAIRAARTQHAGLLRALQRALSQHYDALAKLCVRAPPWLRPPRHDRLMRDAPLPPSPPARPVARAHQVRR